MKHYCFYCQQSFQSSMLLNKHTEEKHIGTLAWQEIELPKTNIENRT